MFLPLTEVRGYHATFSMTRIEKKIVDYSVVQLDATILQMPPSELPKQPERPPVLSGSTYKIITPLSDHAIYVTINDLVHNGKRQPYEIFINSKNMEHYQWIVALTRVISGVFRHGGDIGFLVEELKSVFDPKGGYFKKGGKWMPSLVAEIGDVIGEHLKSAGIFQGDANLGEHLCQKCLTRSVVVSEGCMTCLNCGDSRCG